MNTIDYICAIAAGAVLFFSLWLGLSIGMSADFIIEEIMQ